MVQFFKAEYVDRYILFSLPYRIDSLFDLIKTIKCLYPTSCYTLTTTNEPDVYSISFIEPPTYQPHFIPIFCTIIYEFPKPKSAGPNPSNDLG